MVNSPLIRPYFLGGWHWGGTLDPHDYSSLGVFWGCNPTKSSRSSLKKKYGKEEVHSISSDYIVISKMKQMISASP